MLEIISGLLLLAFALVVPGYFLTLAIFPSKTGIDSLERFAFSIVFSITFLPLLMLIENQLFGIQINFISVASTILVLIAIGVLVWMVRTTRLSVPEQLYVLFPKVPADEAVQLLPKR